MISETYPIDNRGGDRNNLHVKDQGMSQPPHNTYTHTPGMPHTPGMFFDHQGQGPQPRDALGP